MSGLLYTFCLAVLLTVLSTTHASAEAMFMGLGDLPGGNFMSFAKGVSADGSVVVGNSQSSANGANTAEAFRWENGVMTGLGFFPGSTPGSRSEAFAANGDGTVVVGQSEHSSVTGAEASFRWQGGVMMEIEGFSGGFPLEAFGVSADGSVIVGLASSQAYRWENGVNIGLGDLPGGTAGSSAMGVSADGSVVVGRGSRTVGTEAFRWESGVVPVP